MRGHRVFVAVMAVTPDGVEQLPARKHMARVLREMQQQVEFKRREIEHLAVQGDLPPAGGQRQFAVAQHTGRVGRAGLRRAQQVGPAQQGLDARQQLGQRKRLGQVVVGAEFQPQHAVQLGRFGRQHQDGRAAAARPQRFAQLQAVHARHHQVEHQQVMRMRAVARQRGQAVGHFRHVIAGAAQVEHQQVADVGLVFGDEDGLHVHTVEVGRAAAFLPVF